MLWTLVDWDESGIEVTIVSGVTICPDGSIALTDRNAHMPTSCSGWRFCRITRRCYGAPKRDRQSYRLRGRPNEMK